MRINLVIFLSLCLLFLTYSAVLYTVPLREREMDKGRRAGSGRLVWQKYNCQSCHQIYGLGGYLGPDLTNVSAAKGKGDAYILGMLRSGIRQMPAFALTPKEEAELLEFLRAADASGTADPRQFSAGFTGMISEK